MAKKTVSQRIAADPKLKAKYLKNPGLRSKLPASALTPDQRKRREQNTYNAAPITPGSSVTNRALATETDAATKARYGSEQQALDTQYAKAQGLGRDVSGWYDAYRKELQAHAANTQAINAAATDQIGQLGAGMRGLDQGALTAQQTAANTDAATRGASAANLGPDASQASLVRQQMLAGYGVEQVGLGAAATRLADTRANVVAPTQQIQAQAGAAQGVRDVGNKIQELTQRKGAFGDQYRGQRIADESKNVLANAALQNNISNTQTDNAQAAANAAETKRAHSVSATQASNRLTETARSHRANETAAQARIRIAAEKAKKGTAIKPATREAHSRAKDDIDTAQTWIRKLRGDGNTPDQIRAALEQGRTTKDSNKNTVKIPKVSKDFLDAALELAQGGGELSPGVVKALHRRGLSIKDLGLPTASARRKKAGKSPLKRLASDLSQTRKQLRP